MRTNQALLEANTPMELLSSFQGTPVKTNLMMSSFYGIQVVILHLTIQSRAYTDNRGLREESVRYLCCTHIPWINSPVSCDERSKPEE